MLDQILFFGKLSARNLLDVGLVHLLDAGLDLAASSSSTSDSADGARVRGRLHLPRLDPHPPEQETRQRKES